MTFEPLIHVSEVDAALVTGLWSGLVTVIISGLVYLGFRLRKPEDAMSALFTTVCMTFLFGLVLIGFGLQNDQIRKNESIVFSNLSQKYQVEEVEFAPVTKYRSYYPEQSEPQPVMVKANGKTRPAILTQDRETSEPTLTDVDNGQPMDDILKR